jgi:hypothetical protein
LSEELARVGKIAGRGKDVKSTEEIPRIDTRLRFSQVSVQEGRKEDGKKGLESCNEREEGRGGGEKRGEE